MIEFLFFHLYSLLLFLLYSAIAVRERKRKIALAPAGLKVLKERVAARKLRTNQQNSGTGIVMYCTGKIVT